MSTHLTEPQVRALRIVVDAGDRGIAPRAVARLMWPDSPAWHMRTRGRNGRNGAVGGTMPMKAAQLLWRLVAAGLVVKYEAAGVFVPTDKGRQVAR